MQGDCNNAALNKAQADKNDEFYTLPEDVSREISAYFKHNPDTFRGRTVFCPCDNPEWSAFAGHFRANFELYGISRLVCTWFDPAGRGGLYIKDADGETSELLDGNGDFRSREVTAILDTCDIVATNPPFSLFREFMAWLDRSRKKFAVIGNKNALSCKDIFPLFRDNRMWLGHTPLSGGMWFGGPGGESVGRTKLVDGRKLGNVSACWFTNMEHGKRHSPMKLKTMAELSGAGVAFSKYDQFDAIDVGKSALIPGDYPGMMGVPITWLEWYCPEQFEILGLDRYVEGNPKPGKRFTVDGRMTYTRVIIRHR